MKKTNKMLDTQFWVVLSSFILFWVWITYLMVQVDGPYEGILFSIVLLIKVAALAVAVMVGAGTLITCIMVLIAKTRRSRRERQIEDEMWAEWWKENRDELIREAKANSVSSRK